MQAIQLNSTQCHYFISAADSQMRQTYQIGLAVALQKYGVDQKILPTLEKSYYEDTVIILAYAPEGRAIGGIRIEIKSRDNKLPIEKCKTAFQKQIDIKIGRLISDKQTLAEISGLWVDPRRKGTGLGPQLVFESTELALGLGCDVLLCFPPAHTLGYFEKLGYVADTEVPQMAYPDDRYLSTLAWYNRPEPSKLKLVDSQFSLDV